MASFLSVNTERSEVYAIYASVYRSVLWRIVQPGSGVSVWLCYGLIIGLYYRAYGVAVLYPEP